MGGRGGGLLHLPTHHHSVALGYVGRASFVRIVCALAAVDSALSAGPAVAAFVAHTWCCLADGHPEPEEGSTGSKMPAKAVAASLTWHAPSDEWDCVQPVHGLHAWTNSGGSRCSNPACQIRRPGLPIFW